MTILSILIAAVCIGMSIGSVVAIIAAVILSGRVSQEEYHLRDDDLP